MSITPGWLTGLRLEWVSSIRQHARFERTIMMNHWVARRKDPIFDTYYVKHRYQLVAVSIMEGLVT